MQYKFSKHWSWRRAAILFSVIILVLSGVFVYKSMQIHEQSRERTRQYLIDVTYQIHEHIETQIEKSLEMLRLIRNGALDIPQQDLTAYLADQTEFSNFSELYLVDDFDQAEAWLQSHYGAQHTLDRSRLRQGKSQLIAIPGEGALVYFTADHIDENPAVIIGIKTNELLKELLSNNSFDDQALTLVISQSGTIITSQTEENFFDQIHSSYAGTAYDHVPQLFEQMRTDLQAGQSGTLSFPSTGGEALLLSYEPLSFSDWCVFTVIPAKVLDAGIEDLTMQNLILTLVTVLLLGGCTIFLIGQQRRHTRRLIDAAFTDKITGGWNNLRFQLETSRRLQGNTGYTMIALDVADFTFLNNLYGVQAGDDVIRHIFMQILRWLQPDEIAAHSSADLFYILMHTQDQDEITGRLSVLKQRAERYDKLGGGNYQLELHFGAYPIREAGRSVTWMEDNANLARKYHDGHLCSFYRAEKWEKKKLERELINDMPDSLRSGAFEVYLQPKVRLSDNRVDGAEALIRWNHPKKGLLSPGVFIPVFEKARLIAPLDHYMFEQVCKLLHRWRQEGRETCVISVNLSRQNLAIPDLLQKYRAICDAYDVPPSGIELELTESIFMENTEWMRCFVREMHAQGFQCSLDDFGSGYSSLGLLRELDIDVIKLDRSFFTGSEADRKGALVIRAILKLAQQLHIRTVAEGIEHTEQVEMLRKLGCDLVQGFVFFPPMPVADFEARACDNGTLRRLDRPDDAH